MSQFLKFKIRFALTPTLVEYLQCNKYVRYSLKAAWQHMRQHEQFLKNMSNKIVRMIDFRQFFEKNPEAAR